MRNTTRFRGWLPLAILAAVVVAVACGGDSSTGPGGGNGGSGSGSIKIDGSRVELEGYIERVGNYELTVFEYLVIVADTTEIDGEHGDDWRFEDLLVGMWVEIKGTLRGDGAVAAERIDVDDNHVQAYPLN